MTSLLPPSRALSHQFVSRACHLRAANGRTSGAKSWSRVTFNSNLGLLSTLLQCNTSTAIFGQLLSRSYATKPGKPKGHTGRAAASKRKPAVAQSDDAAGVPKKAPAKKSPAKKPAARKKGAAKKPARKAKSKRKPKAKPKRKALSEKQLATKAKKESVQKLKELKTQALLDPPKQLPSTAYLVLSVETSGKGVPAIQHAKDTSVLYKNLNPEEMEVRPPLYFDQVSPLTNNHSASTTPPTKTKPRTKPPSSNG
jgi:hypothetical protein